MKKMFPFMVVVLLFSCTPAWLSMIRSVQSDFRAGLDLYDKKDYAGAVQKLTRAIDNIPVADNMYNASSGILDTESGVNWNLMKSDGILYARSMRSDAYLRLKKYDEAKNDANWVVDYYNKNKCTRESAKKECEGAVERAIFARGEVYRTEGKYNQAIQDYDWVVKNGKILGWNAYEKRGRAYFELKDFETAYAHFDKLVEKYPTFAEYYALRCAAGYEVFNSTTFENGEKGKEEKREKLDQISADCDKALEIDPNNELAKETAVNLVAEKVSDNVFEFWEELLRPLWANKMEEKGKVQGRVKPSLKERAISDRNEFGGQTLETIYEKGDARSEDLKKEIAYFDSNKKKVKAEYSHTDKFADEKGINRSISYFDSTGKRTKAEYFYTEKFANEKKFNKSIAFFDNTGKVTKRELYIGDKLIKKIE